MKWNCLTLSYCNWIKASHFRHLFFDPNKTSPLIPFRRVHCQQREQCYDFKSKQTERNNSLLCAHICSWDGFVSRALEAKNKETMWEVFALHLTSPIHKDLLWHSSLLSTLCGFVSGGEEVFEVTVIFFPTFVLGVCSLTAIESFGGLNDLY